ncbi:Biotin carboxylase [Ruminococcus sp. YE71]|uniref:ATP-grasp domain-containing protein n=1 Tax=unclassified Ruminococcus TaxID=2608920 RepID=UPI00087F0A1B|nr:MULTISPECIES: ATP-grasp domain-containing protein [unclassified Ruminococcus]SDA30703.1 Biotin carboxylase [Ruminococcus sp. YE78]SFW49849.1 Biotin carboxylase [Ruminococcus sp. YE71]
MKKLLLLGGSAQQVIAIDTAKRLGYSTVLCDYLPDNPGQYHADKFYLVSTTDREAVLKVAEEEKVDGVIAYSSDPAAPTAAYVAEKLGLPTNPFRAVDILCNKDKFREFLSENGFDCPKAAAFSDKETALAALTDGSAEYPLIIKPTDSSGSKGVTIMRSAEGVGEAIDFAFSFSRCGEIIAETFIEKKHPYLIGGDIFVYGGRVIIWGLMNCFRENAQFPLVPSGKIYPVSLDDRDLQRVKDVLQDMVTKLGIVSGSMNVELVIGRNDKVYPIDIGPRAGGNMIPIQLSHIFGVDIVEMSVKCAMGESLEVEPQVKLPYCATYVLHSDRDGIYKDIEFSETLESHIFKKCLYDKAGDKVEHFDNAAKALGIIFLRFDSEDEMFGIMNDMKKHIRVVLE